MGDINHLEDLKQDPDNARQHNPRNIGMITNSLHSVGAGRSIVIDEDNVILSGNGVFEAAVEAGIENVQVVEADGETIIAVRRSNLTPEQKKKLAYFDNRTAELADWSPEQLLADLEAGVELGDLFFDSEIEEIMAGMVEETEPPADPGAQTDKAQELQEKWQVRRGQVWELGEHRLACGDCTDRSVVEAVMSGERAGAVVTDPPYGIEREGILNDDPEGLSLLYDGCVAAMPISDAVVIAFQSPRLEWVWLDAIRAKGHKLERLLWMYKPNDETFPWRGWLLTSEAIRVSSVGRGQWSEVHPYAHDCYSPTTLGSELEDGQGHHPSVKPLSVVQDLVSRVGGAVYDPFVGSGTTLIACERLRRKCRAVELVPAYCAITIQRWVDATGGTPKLLTT